jgi:iron(III) transport system permease protein
MIAYFIVRSRFAARTLLDFLSWLPIALPGILVGIGLLWVFLDSPIFRPLYGTLFLLVLATSVTSMATATNIIKSNILQIGPELEDASRVSGASSVHTYRRIVLPLITPVLVLVAVMNFIHAAKDISSVALLATANSRTVSLLQLDYIVGGEHESASVVAVLVIALTTGIALLVRMFGLRPDKRE